MSDKNLRSLKSLKSCVNCANGHPADSVPNSGIPEDQMLCEIASRIENDNIGVLPETAVNCRDFESDLSPEIELLGRAQSIVSKLVEAESELSALAPLSKLFGKEKIFSNPHRAIPSLFVSRRYLSIYISYLQEIIKSA